MTALPPPDEYARRSANARAAHEQEQRRAAGQVGPWSFAAGAEVPPDATPMPATTETPATKRARGKARIEAPIVLAIDTREPAIEANDHPDSVFRPCVFAADIPKGTPWTVRPRVVLPSVRRKLEVGDYSIEGLEGRVALERKSGPDLLSTLFGSAGLDSCGEEKHNLDRFRAELERAMTMRYELFAIVCEASVSWLFAEAQRREGTYGKAFDPFAVLSILRSFEVDLACPTIWCGSKGLAELYVGETLSRVHSQATGGAASKKARKRGYNMPWLDALVAKAEVAA